MFSSTALMNSRSLASASSVFLRMARSCFSQCAGHGGHQPLQPVLEQVIRRATFQTFDRLVFSDGAGKEDKRNVAVAGTDGVQGCRAVIAGQTIVGQDDI